MRSESELRFAVGRSRKDGYQLLFQQYHSYVYDPIGLYISRLIHILSPSDMQSRLAESQA